MTDDPPLLGFTSQEIWNYTQTANALVALAQRIRRDRERSGRLAHGDAEHAAQQHESRQHPPLRLMTADEEREWQRRIPASLAAQPHGERFSVWSAQLTDGRGQRTGQWGLEAHTWDERGRPLDTLHIVCRDAEDALAMTQYLRETGTGDDLARLRELAEHGHGRFVQARPPRPRSTRATTGQVAGEVVPLVLSEQDWEAALRRALRPEDANRLIIKDPAHRHYDAWHELHELANEEVIRVGANPDRLADLIRRVPRWNSPMRNPPALAYSVLADARMAARYPQTIAEPGDPAVAPSPDNAPAPATPARSSASTPGAARLTRGQPVRLKDVRSPDSALDWARGLNPASAEHRIEAKAGYGRFGGEVDGILTRKFPSVARKAATAAKTERQKNEATPVAASVAAGDPDIAPGQEPPLDPADLAELAAEVDRLDPEKPIDRRAALIMIGHVPTEIDRRIAQRFADDPLVVEKITTEYPDGLPEADAAAWRNRAEGEDAAAIAATSTSTTPAAWPNNARTDREVAAQDRGIATTVAGQRPRVITTVQPVPATPGRRP
jgi:hypothetical protein